MSAEILNMFHEITEEVTGQKYRWVNDTVTDYTVGYILKSVVKETVLDINIEELRETLNNIYCGYTLITTHSDIFVETTANSERFSNLFIEQTMNQNSISDKAIKKDLDKIVKNIEQIKDIYHRNYAGKAIDKVISEQNYNKKTMFKELGQLELICNDLIRYYSPEQGRTPSKERIERIHMVADIMEIFKSLKIPHGSGEEGSFYVFIIKIYEMLKIEVNTPNRDIKEARQMLIDKKH